MEKLPILTVTDLHKFFPAARRKLFQRTERWVHAVDGVTFNLDSGEVLAFAGESGCGKSTLALTLMNLEKATSGKIIFEGKDVTNLNGAELKTMRRQIQMVFQDPYESLNPLMSVYETVEEPLLVHGLFKNDAAARQVRVSRAIEDAGLKPAEIYFNRLPHELSGGQRQRVVIAGALVLEPRLLLADEPVSMLDVSIRAEILNLFSELRRTRGISILIISHDLATSAYLAERIAVMYLGRIVEIGTVEHILKTAHHPYTQALLTVIPVPNPRRRRQRIILQGDPPNAIDLPTGCRFHPRCPKVFERCKIEEPDLITVADGHSAACWLAK
jgi:oligopeptide/dipeptide ABC transporter ATP-binding protein